MAAFTSQCSQSERENPGSKAKLWCSSISVTGNPAYVVRRTARWQASQCVDVRTASDEHWQRSLRSILPSCWASPMLEPSWVRHSMWHTLVWRQLISMHRHGACHSQLGDRYTRHDEYQCNLYCTPGTRRGWARGGWGKTCAGVSMSDVTERRHWATSLNDVNERRHWATSMSDVNERRNWATSLRTSSSVKSSQYDHQCFMPTASCHDFCVAQNIWVNYKLSNSKIYLQLHLKGNTQQ